MDGTLPLPPFFASCAPLIEGCKVSNVEWDQFVESIDGEASFRAPIDHLSDRLLAFLVGKGNRLAIGKFEREHLSRIHEFVRKIDPPSGTREQFVDEIAQTARIRCLVAEDDGRPPRILDYKGSGPLGGWLRVMAVRIALDFVKSKKRGAENLSELGDEAFAPVSSAESVEIKKRWTPLLQNALRSAITTLDDESRTVLQLYYGRSLAIDDMSEILGVHRATCARWVTSARTKLRSSLENVLHKEAGIEESMLRDILPTLLSNLDFTWSFFAENESRTSVKT